ncbi:MAG: UDP-N-acetylglucosamine 1-carboxyvinyltransferase [Desulfotomaculum sp. 46_296]|nr:MAG: UDP-N-acetylglucosamine 1-carboxyvinyltransferase [Desulfotomaculum sp. 46_296]HAU31393.1 UDP-N-acetylglucosamine 1-carboxyvinyltransferase [Desulfotomaculum sp.]
MSKLVVRGGRVLSGRVRVSGAKNAALAILCASVMAQSDVSLENIPKIEDLRVMTELIKSIGAVLKWTEDDSLTISMPDAYTGMPTYALAKKLRASNLLIGPMLARFGRAEICLPGGCDIGLRPMDLHFKGFAALGARMVLEKGIMKAEAGHLKGARVYLDFPSVGATENIMMAACLARGQTVIENCAKEPEIVDLASFLNCLGGKVRGAGTDIIKIEGVEYLNGCTHYNVIPDRIEAGTFMIAAAATGGDIKLENVIPLHVEPLSAKLREAGLEVIEEEDSLRIRVVDDLRSLDIKTMPYPGFPTDLQSQMMTLLSTAPGTSEIIENIFENRFRVADELRRMGAAIKVKGRMALIRGVPKLYGAQVRATDLRAGAALVVAGLMAEGETEISGSDYIDRGYYKLEDKLSSLGGSVFRS